MQDVQNHTGEIMLAVALIILFAPLILAECTYRGAAILGLALVAGAGAAAIFGSVLNGGIAIAQALFIGGMIAGGAGHISRAVRDAARAAADRHKAETRRWFEAFGEPGPGQGKAEPRL